MNHHPMTKEQSEILDRDLATVKTSLGDIAILLGACYGDEDPRLVRAEEAQGAVQRLLWALERQAQPTTTENVAGLARVREIEVGRKARAQIEVFRSR